MKSLFTQFPRLGPRASSAHSTEQESASRLSDKIFTTVEVLPSTYRTRHPSTLQDSNSQGPLPATPTLPDQLAPSSSFSGICKKCSPKGVTEIQKSGNHNENMGRPFLNCHEHGFIRWLDERGVHANNPLCDCGWRSRRNVSGSHKGRKVFFNCTEGKCRFWQTDKRADGQDWCVDDDMVELLRRLDFI